MGSSADEEVLDEKERKKRERKEKKRERRRSDAYKAKYEGLTEEEIKQKKRERRESKIEKKKNKEENPEGEGSDKKSKKSKKEKEPEGAEPRMTPIEYAAIAILVLDVILLIVGIALFAAKPTCIEEATTTEAPKPAEPPEEEEEMADVAVQTVDAGATVFLKDADMITADFSCGVPKIEPNTDEVGDAVAHSWPWVVSVGHVAENSESGDNTHLCTGTLLSSRHVLTTAGCFASDEPLSKNYSVFVKHADIGTFEGGATHQVSVIRLHPKTDAKEGVTEPVYDFAILSLEDELSFSDQLLPACLPKAESLPPTVTTCWSPEWGSTEEDSTLKQSKVEFVTESVCMEKYEEENKKEVVICGNKGADSCRQDSSSPVTCEVDGKWVLYGLKSYGPEDCLEELPFAYASVSYHVSWFCCYMDSLPQCSKVKCKASGDPDVEAGFVAKVYEGDMYEKKDYESGIPKVQPTLVKSRIIGGLDAVPHSWPWVMSITEYKENLEHFCGGTLVTPRHVLSAASCFEVDRGFEEGRLYVLVRPRDRLDGTLRRVSMLRKHPKGSGDEASSFDLMLLTLYREVLIDDHTIPVAMPGLNADLEANITCWIQGWGANETGSAEQPMKLKQASSFITAAENCAGLSGDKELGDAICGKQENEICEGDSGGPLTCQEDGKWVLYGVASWRKDCGSSGYEIFSSVSASMGWICCYLTEIPECSEQPCMQGAEEVEEGEVARITPDLVETVQSDALRLYPEDTFYPDFSCGTAANDPNLQTGRIIGGGTSVQHSWPWVVSLETKSPGNSAKFCVGSLVSLRHVVSAASCFTEERGFYDGKLYARVGHHDSSSWGMLYKVVRLRKHPVFDASKPDLYNVALLTVEPEVVLSDDVSPICLPRPYTMLEAESKCWTQGWGSSEPDSDVPTEALTQLQLTVAPMKKCWEQLSLEKEFSVLCAEKVEDKGPCSGDGGAPLSCNEEQSDVKGWTLYGAVANPTCGSDSMTTLVSVSFVADWICCFMEKSASCWNVTCNIDGMPRYIPEIGEKKVVLKLIPEDTYSRSSFTCGDQVLYGGRPRQSYIDTGPLDPLWPWAATLQYDGRHFCGAALVTPKHAISTATCFTEEILTKGTVTAKVETKLIGKVQLVRLHPKFDPANENYYNIALLTFMREVSFGPSASPICLPKNSTDVVDGWKCATMNYLRQYPSLWSEMSRTTAVMRDLDVCVQFYSLELSNEYAICGEETFGTSVSCHGDTGNPMGCKFDKKYHLFGVVGDVLTCSTAGGFTVFSAISYVVDWICCFMPNAPSCSGQPCSYAMEK